MIKLSDELYIPPMGDVLAERDRLRKTAAAAKNAKRSHYAAAKINRLNADWTTTPYGANWTLYRDLRILRARARAAAANAPHFAKVLKLAKSNIVGQSGIQLQCRSRLPGGELNPIVNKQIEELFWEWGFSENCSVTGKLSWLHAQNLAVEHLFRDGEVLIRHFETGPFGYQIKFVNVDYLDETHTETLPNGNRVIMSVEVDPNDRPVAYWLTTPSSEINFTPRRLRLRSRVPAEEMTHVFLISDDETQTRGVTWFHSVLLEGRNLEVYKNAVIESAKMSSMTGGFFTKTESDETQYSGVEGDETGEERDIEIDFTPASFHLMPDGYDFKQFDPKQPTQNHAAYKQTILMDIATGVGLPYFEVAGDMSAVNFSSARVGKDESRDIWRQLQKFIADSFCRPIYHRFIRAAMLAGRLNLSTRDFLEAQNPNWQGRGWQYMEPLKDINAASIAIANGLSSFTAELSARGIDINEHIETLVQERKLMEKTGVDLSILSVGQAKKPSDDEEEINDEQKENEDRGYTNGANGGYQLTN